MKKQKDSIHYFFVDESGDPTFYDRYGKLIVGTEGVSKLLILGFIKTNDPKPIRHVLLNLKNNLSKH